MSLIYLGFGFSLLGREEKLNLYRFIDIDTPEIRQFFGGEPEKCTMENER
jgi:hypothetical protein